MQKPHNDKDYTSSVIQEIAQTELLDSLRASLAAQFITLITEVESAWPGRVVSSFLGCRPWMPVDFSEVGEASVTRPADKKAV